MKLATRRNGSPDGELIVVSKLLDRAVAVPDIAATLLEAIENWDVLAPNLQAIYDQLNGGSLTNSFPFIAEDMMAPLPRTWQWLDGSVYPNHGDLMQTAFNLPPIEYDKPLMYQGMSHKFYAGHENIPFLSEADGIDFEAEFGVITKTVAMGSSAKDAASSICLAVLINDWSLRTIAPVEMKTGFGWVQAKPACSVAPVTVTLDELGDLWQDNRIIATMKVTRSGKLFGQVPGDEMEYGFNELVAHAAGTRDLCAGTIIGSGTVSSKNYQEVGSCCIAERRAIEMIDKGIPETGFLHFNETVTIDAVDNEGKSNLFGPINQRVIQSN